MEEKDFEKENQSLIEEKVKETKPTLQKNKLFAQENVEVEERVEDVTAVVNPTIQPTERKRKKKNKIKKQRTVFDKLGILFVVLSIISLLIGLMPLAAAIVIAIYAVLLFAFAAFTLFLILLNKEFQEKFKIDQNPLLNFAFDVIAPISKYLFLGAGVFAVLAAVMFGVSKTKYDKVAKVVLCSILAAVSIALSVFVFSGVIKPIS
ncbi:MAG: hypothetical protein ACOX6H_01355 [Christensenellales bacterium]|jgi:hypothetical protein